MEKLGTTDSLPLWHKGGRGAASLIIGGLAATFTEALFDLMVEKIKNRRAARKQ